MEPLKRSDFVEAATESDHLLLVGLSQGKHGANLDDRAKQRLAFFLDWTIEEVRRRFKFRNLREGEALNGSSPEWTPARFRLAGSCLISLVKSRGGRWVVVFLGRPTSEAFIPSGLAYFEPVRLHEYLGSRIDAITIPHPAWENRWWSEPENQDRARKFLKLVLGPVRTTIREYLHERAKGNQPQGPDRAYQGSSSAGAASA